MKQYDLGFISDRDIYEHVKSTVLTYRRSINLREFNRNVIDPIKLTFDAKVYGKTFEEMVDNECVRQIDKTNTNNIGYFHQNLFKFAGNGWVVPRNGETGFDVENPERHIYCEVKNKHNTMNSSSSSNIYIKMQNKILLDDQAVCYLVQIISKKSQDSKWNLTIDGRRFSHERIRIISIDKFYELVFGVPDAFMRLCKTLPLILEDVIEEEKGLMVNNTVFDELKTEGGDLYRNLYMLAFKTYEGFDRF